MNVLDAIPNELLIQIFHFIPTSKDLVNLSMTCKKYYKRIRDEQSLWKTLCLEWWNIQGLSKKSVFSLGQVKEYSTKDWIWFISSFYSQKTNGLSYKISSEWVDLGQMIEGDLNGFGILIHLIEPFAVSVGNFAQGFLEGYAQVIYNDGTSEKGDFATGLIHGFAEKTTKEYTYKGQWKDDEVHGEGDYSWKSGTRYVGEFERGFRSGKGTLTCFDGFQFTCEWLESQPLDEEAATHPKIRDCIQMNICTGNLTKNKEGFCQFLYDCKECRDSENSSFCFTCYNSCHYHQLLGYEKYWTEVEECACVALGNCKKHQTNKI